MASSARSLRRLSQMSPPCLQTTPAPRLHSSSSVSPSEVSHFQQLASTWWDPHGPSRLLHLMNPLRHDFISSCRASAAGSTSPPLSATSPPSRILRYLDVGCGGGIFAESAARHPRTAHVTAIDPTPEIVRVAAEHAARDPALRDPDRLRYVHSSIEDLPVPEAPEELFDVLALWEVVEHVRYPAQFLERCLPLVKPGGWLVGSTIARSWTSWLTTKVMAEHVLGLVPLGTHDWNQYVNPGELRDFFGRQTGWAGGGGVKIAGCLYVPGLGWRMFDGSAGYGNYFFGVRRNTGSE